MVPDAPQDFFIASAGASAALIGLLFVAVSIQTERVFGPNASGDRLAFAGSAFFTLSNILFISLGGLLPRLNVGIVIVVAGIGGVTNTLALLLDLWRRGDRRSTRTLVLVVGNLSAYIAECWWGAALWRNPTQVTALDNTTYALLILYAVGLARAWEVLGGTDYSLVRALRQRINAVVRRDDD